MDIELGIPGVRAWQAGWGWVYALWGTLKFAAPTEALLKEKVLTAMALAA